MKESLIKQIVERWNVNKPSSSNNVMTSHKVWNDDKDDLIEQLEKGMKDLIDNWDVEPCCLGIRRYQLKNKLLGEKE